MNYTNFVNQGIDNLFSANHRNGMIQRHKGTMASFYSVKDFVEALQNTLNVQHDCKMSKGYCSACVEIADLSKGIGTELEYGKQFAV